MNDLLSEVPHSVAFAFFYAVFGAVGELIKRALPVLFPLNVSRLESDKVARLAEQYEDEVASLVGV